MFKKKGQSTVEYALILAVVVAGLLLMQHYVRRGYAGRIKGASDDIGEQYDPTAYTGTFGISQSSNTRQTVSSGTRTSRTQHTAPQVSSRTGGETVGAWTQNQDLYNK